MSLYEDVLRDLSHDFTQAGPNDYAPRQEEPRKLSVEIKLSEIGTHLREWRKQNGFTLQDVENLVDIRVSHLSDVERGVHSISVYKLDLLLTLYDVQLRYVPSYTAMNNEKSNE